MSSFFFVGIKKFYAKFSRQNVASIRLFGEKFKFARESESDVFDEVTLVRVVDEEFLSLLTSIFEIYDITLYCDSDPVTL